LFPLCPLGTCGEACVPEFLQQGLGEGVPYLGAAQEMEILRLVGESRVCGEEVTVLFPLLPS
jgi:hypothetical protein